MDATDGGGGHGHGGPCHDAHHSQGGERPALGRSGGPGWRDAPTPGGEGLFPRAARPREPPGAAPCAAASGPRSSAGTVTGRRTTQAGVQIDRRTASRALHGATTGAARTRPAGSDAPHESLRAGSGRRNAATSAIATRAKWRHRAARSSSSSQQRRRNSISDWADDRRWSSAPAALHAPHLPARCCAYVPPSSCSSTRY